MDKKIITLGGSFETGKTTMYEALKSRKGEQYRFVPDTLSPLLEAYPCAEFEEPATSVQAPTARLFMTFRPPMVALIISSKISSSK